MVATRDKTARAEHLARVYEFRVRYEAARLAFAAGVHDVVFPEGTYKLRELGARCAPPPEAIAA